MAHKSHRANRKKDGEQTPQKSGREIKPLSDIITSVRANMEEEKPFILIEMNENPAPPERNRFFTFVEQLTKKLGLSQPSFFFTTKEIQICWNESIPSLSWNSFVKGLKSFLFPSGDKEPGIIIDTEMLRLLSFPL